MHLNDYQSEAVKFALPTALNAPYLCFGLAGEVGEVLEIFAKIVRDQGGVISPDNGQAIKRELGDVMWMVANLADWCGLTLDDISRTNLAKLAERGVIAGSGDDR
jgi:NTP pyrophosphatase (non-canonical NTP hydrolase)